MDDVIVDINIYKYWSKIYVLKDKNKISYVI